MLPLHHTRSNRVWFRQGCLLQREAGGRHFVLCQQLMRAFWCGVESGTKPPFLSGASQQAHQHTSTPHQKKSISVFFGEESWFVICGRVCDTKFLSSFLLKSTRWLWVVWRPTPVPALKAETESLANKPSTLGVLFMVWQVEEILRARRARVASKSGLMAPPNCIAGTIPGGDRELSITLLVD